jgi:membrane-associated phospholipid phosphatase
VPGGSHSRRVAALTALSAAWVLLLVLVVTKWSPLRDLDLDVAGDLHRVAVDHPEQVDWWKWVSTGLHPDVERIAWAVAAVALYVAHRVRLALFVVIVMVGAAVLEAVSKLAVARNRPEFAHPVASAAGKSFPSGHALSAVVAFGLVVLLVPPRVKLAAGVIGTVAVLLVSYSRVALGVHYVSDVVAGWLLGAAWLVLAGWLLGDRLLTVSDAPDNADAAPDRRG